MTTLIIAFAQDDLKVVIAQMPDKLGIYNVPAEFKDRVLSLMNVADNGESVSFEDAQVWLKIAGCELQEIKESDNIKVLIEMITQAAELTSQAAIEKPKHLLMAGQVSDTNGNFRRNYVASYDDLEEAKGQVPRLLADHYDWINIITVRDNTPVMLAFWDNALQVWIEEDMTE